MSSKEVREEVTCYHFGKLQINLAFVAILDKWPIKRGGLQATTALNRHQLLLGQKSARLH